MPRVPIPWPPPSCQQCPVSILSHTKMSGEAQQFCWFHSRWRVRLQKLCRAGTITLHVTCVFCIMSDTEERSQERALMT